MIPFDEWPDPEEVGEGEYSAICEFFSDMMTDLPYFVDNEGQKVTLSQEEIDASIKGSLMEFIGWASYLLGEDAPAKVAIRGIQDEIDASSQDRYEGDKEMREWSPTDIKILGMEFARDTIKREFTMNGLIGGMRREN